MVVFIFKVLAMDEARLECTTKQGGRAAVLPKHPFVVLALPNTFPLNALSGSAIKTWHLDGDHDYYLLG